MIQTLKPWLYWGLALLLAAASVLVVLWLHQLRPDQGVIRLEQALFVSSSAAASPAVGERVAIGLPDDWRLRSVQGPVGWYRLELNLEVPPNRLWALYIPALEMTPAILVNGALVGGDSAPLQPLPRYWNRPLLFSIPNGLLHPGSNIIDLRLEANGPWGRLSEIYIGPREVLEPAYDQRHFWRVNFLNVTTVGSLMLSLFMAALYLAHRQSVYLWFAAFALAWFLENFVMLTVQPPVSNASWDLFTYVVVGWMVTTAGMFAFRFLGLSEPRWEKLLIGTAATGPLALLGVLQFSVPAFNEMGSLVWNALIVLIGLYPVQLIVKTMLRRQDVEIFFLAVCYPMALALGAHDWLVTSGLGYRHNGMLMQFATAPILATFCIILLKRFVSSLRETDALNSDLEQRVAAKATEIEASFKRNQELEAAQLLSRERERIMRDMHDGIGSQLIGMLGSLDHTDPRDRVLQTDLKSALDDLRLMIDSLDDVENDVVVALGLFRNRIQPQLDAAGLHLDWLIDDMPPVTNLGPERVLQFMRILQEAVSNCIKHANATRLTIETREAEWMNGRKCVCVYVTDNGCGLETEATQGRGLANMRQRALDADLEFLLSTGALGTTIQIGFPTN